MHQLFFRFMQKFNALTRQGIFNEKETLYRH